MGKKRNSLKQTEEESPVQSHIPVIYCSCRAWIYSTLVTVYCAKLCL